MATTVTENIAQAEGSGAAGTSGSARKRNDFLSGFSRLDLLRQVEDGTLPDWVDVQWLRRDGTPITVRLSHASSPRAFTLRAIAP